MFLSNPKQDLVSNRLVIHVLYILHRKLRVQKRQEVQQKEVSKLQVKASDLMGLVNQDSFFSISINMWISWEGGGGWGTSK